MEKTTISIIDDLFIREPSLAFLRNDLISALDILISAFSSGGKLLLCGNGGSAADCEHIVGELLKGFVLKREIDQSLSEKLDDPYLSKHLQLGLPVISLVSQTAFMTAYMNDEASDLIFAQQTLNYGNKGDVLLAISTSGNSANCIYAAKVAKVKEMKVISLTGMKASKLEVMSDVTIKAPSDITFEIQEYHLPIYHTICLALENEFFGG